MMDSLRKLPLNADRDKRVPEAPSDRPQGTLGGRLSFLFPRKSRSIVMYPWPTGDFDNVMDVALDIAMDYLERTGQALKFLETQRVAATAIITAWQMGERRRLRLANVPIKAVERKTERFLEDQKRG
jgi:hypothetical protein